MCKKHLFFKGRVQKLDKVAKEGFTEETPTLSRPEVSEETDRTGIWDSAFETHRKPHRDLDSAFETHRTLRAEAQRQAQASNRGQSSQSYGGEGGNSRGKIRGNQILQAFLKESF